MRTGGSRKKQEGAVAITVALCMVVLLGIAAFAIDLGNLLVARNELQNAADAAAMAGAGCLIKRTQCSNTTATQPDWTTAASEASGFATSTATPTATSTATSTATNQVQGAYVQVSTVATGYWNATGTPYGLESLPFTPGANDLPAVQVTILKDGSNANGAVPVFLGRVFGAQILKASAVATAVLSTPGNVGPGGLFPMAMSQCLFNTYWNSATNSPDLATSTTPLPGGTVNQIPGQPYIFQIGTAYQYNGCQAGQWTTLTSQINNVPFVQGLIAGQNTDSLGIGQSPGTYVQPGEKDVIYQNVAACSAAGNGSCAWETMPVVSSLNTGSYNPVVAFACVHILNARNGSQPYVLVQMSSDMSHCETPNSGGVGPNYGAYTPPRLVQ